LQFVELRADNRLRLHRRKLFAHVLSLKRQGSTAPEGAGERDTISGMSRKAQKVLEEALTLPPPERADLAATLLDSLDEQEDEGVEEAWAREIERRIQEVESGAVKMIPWSEARRRLRARLDAARRP